MRGTRARKTKEERRTKERAPKQKITAAGSRRSRFRTAAGSGPRPGRRPTADCGLRAAGCGLRAAGCGLPGYPVRELSYSAIRTVGHRADAREHTFELHRTGGDTSPATNDKSIKETTMKHTAATLALSGLLAFTAVGCAVTRDQSTVGEYVATPP